MSNSDHSDSEPDTFEAEAITTSSEFLNIALQSSVYEWRMDVQEAFRDPTDTDTVPISILDKVLQRMRVGRVEGGRRYVLVPPSDLERHTSNPSSSLDGDLLDTEASVSLVSMPWIFTTQNPRPLEVVGHQYKLELERRLNMMSSPHLQQCLEYMWDGNIFSDVLIAFPCNDDDDEDAGESKEENGVVVFLAHRFLLRARSPYFREILRNDDGTQFSTERSTLVIFPKANLKPHIWEIVFGFMYTGKFKFKFLPQTFSADLSDAWSIHRASVMLQLYSLNATIHLIIVEMHHGLFRAPMSGVAYDQLIGGIWTNMTRMGGCVCAQCVHHVPLVLAQSMQEDFGDKMLERGAQRALVGMFGPGWCTEEFLALPARARISILDDLRKLMTPSNIFSLIFALESALTVAKVMEEGGEDANQLMFLALAYIDEVFTDNFSSCFDCMEWKQIVNAATTTSESSGSQEWRVEVWEKFLWIANLTSRCMRPLNSAALHQTLEPFLLVGKQLFTLGDSDLMVKWSRQISLMVERFTVDMERDSPGPATIPEESRDSSASPSGADESQVKAIESPEPLESSKAASASIPPAVSNPAADQDKTKAIYSGERHISGLTIASLRTSFSNASSRTASTDYGTFYRRMCLSEDFTDEFGNRYS